MSPSLSWSSKYINLFYLNSFTCISYTRINEYNFNLKLKLKLKYEYYTIKQLTMRVVSTENLN